MIGYLKMKAPFYCFGKQDIMYFDILKPKYLMDQIFIDKKLKVKFLRRELRNTAHNICAVFIRLKKKDIPVFEESLKRLENSMIIKGYQNELDMSNSCFDLMKEGSDHLDSFVTVE